MVGVARGAAEVASRVDAISHRGSPAAHLSGTLGPLATPATLRCTLPIRWCSGPGTQRGRRSEHGRTSLTGRARAAGHVATAIARSLSRASCRHRPLCAPAAAPAPPPVRSLPALLTPGPCGSSSPVCRHAPAERGRRRRPTLVSGGRIVSSDSYSSSLDSPAALRAACRASRASTACDV